MTAPAFSLVDSGSLTTASDANNDYFTASKTFTAGHLYLVFLALTSTAGAPSDPAVTFTVNTGAWTKLRSRSDSTNHVLIGCWYVKPGSGLTDTIKIDGTVAMSGWDWVVVDVTGFKDTGTLADAFVQSNDSTNAASGTPSLALPGAATSGNLTAGFLLALANQAISPGANFTELVETAGHTAPPVRAQLETSTSAAQTTMDWTMTSAAYLAVVVELAAAGGASITGAAALSGTGSQVVAGVRIRLGAAALAGTGSSTIVGRSTRKAAAGLAGTGSQVVAGVKIRTGVVALSGLGTQTVAGNVAKRGVVALSATSGIVVAGRSSRFGAATFGNPVRHLIGTGISTRKAAAALGATSGVVVAGARVAVGAVSLSGVGSTRISPIGQLHGPWVGFYAAPRPSDPSVWTVGDGFDDNRDSITRAELEMARPIDVDRVYRPLSNTTAQPDGYLTWTLAHGHRILLSLKSMTEAAVVIPFGDVAAGSVDAKIDAWADALVVLAPPPGWLYLCYDHEQGLDEGYQVRVVAPGASGTSIPVQPLPIALANGQVIATAGLGTRTVSGAHSAGATSITVTAATTWPANTVVSLQTIAQAGADFAAAWQRIRTRMEARPGFKALRALWTPIYLNSVTQFAGATPPADSWYPGAAFVDRLGWDGAYVVAPAVNPFSGYFETQGFLAWARAKGKKIVIGECGFADDGAHVSASVTWFNDIQAYLQHSNDVDVWGYFTGASHGNWLETAPEGSASKLAAFNALQAAWAVGTKTGAAALSGTGSLTANGKRLRKGAAALAGLGAQTVAGVRIRLGAVALSATSSITVAGVHIGRGAVALSGTGSAVVAGRRTTFGVAHLAGAGSASASASFTQFGAAALHATSSITVAGAYVRIGVIALAGVGSQTVAARRTRFAVAALGGLGTQTVAGSRRAFGDVDLIGIGTVVVTGRAFRFAAADLEGLGTLSATPRATPNDQGTLGTAVGREQVGSIVGARELVSGGV